MNSSNATKSRSRSRTRSRSKSGGGRKSARPSKPRSNSKPRRTKPPKLPRTAKIPTRGTRTQIQRSRATNSMSMTDLQFMAQSMGIPWGGIDSRSKLVKKINNYV